MVVVMFEFEEKSESMYYGITQVTFTGHVSFPSLITFIQQHGQQVTCFRDKASTKEKFSDTQYNFT